MHGILLLSSPKTALGTVLASLATDGFRHGVRNHGYRLDDYAILLRHSGRGSVQIGMRHLPKGNTSSLLCLCGISVSLACYVLYLKFYARFYNSAILKRVIKRLLQTRAQRQVGTISSSSSSRKRRTLQHATSFSISVDTCNDDENNNTDSIKTSEADIGGICSVVGSVDSFKQDAVIFGEFHQLPTVPACAAAAASASATAAELRIRHRITRRRRTLSDCPGVIARLDDFICLIPEIVDRPRHVQRTRNVLDWLAQIDFDAETASLSLFDEEDPLNADADGSSSDGRTRVLHPLESTRSGSGTKAPQSSHNCICQECRSNASADCLAGSRMSDSTTVEVGQEDLGQGQGWSVLLPDSREAELQRSKGSTAASGGPFRRNGDRWSTNQCSADDLPMLDGSQDSNDSEVGEKVDVAEEELESSKKPVFYFEEDDMDTASEKGVPLPPVRFETSPGQRRLSETPLNPDPYLVPTKFSSTDGPHGGSPGYDWLRMRILGADRKRRISTGSALSAKFLASRGLLRNHHSFTSAISGASSGYTYRESLVSKGFSIDCGEDLNDLIIQGEDLLDAAEFSRYTLTNIDQLHEELEVIQRSISYINDKVEFLQSRDDLPDFSARYGYGLVESIRNDPSIMEADAFESGMPCRRQRSRSLSCLPAEAFDAHESLTYREIEDVQPPPVAADEFVWDYGSDLTALNSAFGHHRSLNGLQSGPGEDLISNQLGTRRSRSDELEFTYQRDLSSSNDLSLVKSDEICDDGQPEVTSFAHLPARQRTESICDEYFDDDYEMLTHLHT